MSLIYCISACSKNDDKIRNKKFNWCKRNKSQDWPCIIINEYLSETIKRKEIDLNRRGILWGFM